MVYQAPIPIGSLAWGTPVNDTFADLHARNETGPMDHGAVVFTFDPAANSGSSTIATGTPFMSKVWLREPATITSLGVSITTAGGTLTAGQNFVGIYNQAGSRVAVSADCTAQFALTGFQAIPLTAPALLAAGPYYLTLLANAVTSPSFALGAVAGSGPTTINYNLTAATGRYATGPAAQTSLPLSITMASRTLSAVSMWTVAL
jgi:hypothetical protein